MTNEELVMKIKGGDDAEGKLLLELFEQNRGLIHKYIRKYGNLLEYEDAKQESFIALMDAVNNFKPELGLFYTFYGYYLQMRFSNYLISNAPFVYPRHRFWQVVKYWKIVNSYPLEFGRDATPEEIASILDIPINKVSDLKRDAEKLHIASLDSPIDADNGEICSIGDLVASDTDIEDEVVTDIMEQALYDALWDIATSKTGIDKETLGLMYNGKISHTQASEILAVTYKKLRSMLYGGMDKIKRSKEIASLYELAVATDRYYSYGLKHNGVKSFQETQSSGTELAVIKIFDEEEKKEL